MLGFDALAALVPEAIRSDFAPLRQVLGHWRMAAHGEMARALDSRRTNELLADWEMLLESLVELPTDDRPDATRAIGELAGKRIRKAYKRVVRIGRSIDPGSPPEAFHELRKKGKELRYMLELFGAQLHPDEVVGPMVKSLKALQDVLGRHQDREVQIAMLRSLADEVATLPRGPRGADGHGRAGRPAAGGRGGGAGGVLRAVRRAGLQGAARAGQEDVRLTYPSPAHS